MSTAPGRVYLVGGGPGSEDLLTVAAVNALRIADVVFYDRLAPHENLATLAPGALLVDVGKRPGHHPVGQDGIERMVVERALGGETVVRLKGGDSYVFGRGSEEVLACRRAGVEVTVIPGVSSAFAVPAAVGIPLTHREVSHLFTVVSGHAPLTASELEHLAGLGGTIVVLMGIGTLPSLVQGLLSNGMSRTMPVAIIERGYSATQRTTISELAAVTEDSARAGVVSPAVMVIGEVVHLAHEGDGTAAELLARARGLASTG